MIVERVLMDSAKDARNIFSREDMELNRTSEWEMKEDDGGMEESLAMAYSLTANIL